MRVSSGVYPGARAALLMVCSSSGELLYCPIQEQGGLYILQPRVISHVFAV